MIALTLYLTDAESDAMVEDVTFDTNTAFTAGGHPASASLLRKIKRAIKDGEHFYASDEITYCLECGRALRRDRTTGFVKTHDHN